MHVANMCMATMLAYDRTEELDGCSWYWVAVLADCTVGVLLTWLLLAALRRLYQRAGLRELAQCARGEAGHRGAWRCLRVSPAVTPKSQCEPSCKPRLRFSDL